MLWFLCHYLWVCLWYSLFSCDCWTTTWKINSPPVTVQYLNVLGLCVDSVELLVSSLCAHPKPGLNCNCMPWALIHHFQAGSTTHLECMCTMPCYCTFWCSHIAHRHTQYGFTQIQSLYVILHELTGPMGYHELLSWVPMSMLYVQCP